MRGTTIKLYPIQIGWFTSPCKPKLAVQIFSRKKCNNNKQKKGAGESIVLSINSVCVERKRKWNQHIGYAPHSEWQHRFPTFLPYTVTVESVLPHRMRGCAICYCRCYYPLQSPLKNYPETFHPIFCAAFTAQQLLHSRVALNVIKRPRYLERWYSWNKSASYLSSRCLRYLKRGNWRTNWLVSCELVIKSSGAVTRSNFVQSFDETLAEVDDRVCWGECSLMLHRILVGEPTVENDNK